MEYIIPTLVVIVIAIVLFSLLASIVRIVPQSRAYVITWLGTFRTVWDAGLFPDYRPQAVYLRH